MQSKTADGEWAGTTCAKLGPSISPQAAQSTQWDYTAEFGIASRHAIAILVSGRTAPYSPPVCAPGEEATRHRQLRDQQRALSSSGKIGDRWVCSMSTQISNSLRCENFGWLHWKFLVQYCTVCIPVQVNFHTVLHKLHYNVHYTSTLTFIQTLSYMRVGIQYTIRKD